MSPESGPAVLPAGLPVIAGVRLRWYGCPHEDHVEISDALAREVRSSRRGRARRCGSSSKRVARGAAGAPEAGDVRLRDASFRAVGYNRSSGAPIGSASARPRTKDAERDRRRYQRPRVRPPQRRGMARPAAERLRASPRAARRGRSMALHPRVPRVVTHRASTTPSRSTSPRSVEPGWSPELLLLGEVRSTGQPCARSSKRDACCPKIHDARMRRSASPRLEALWTVDRDFSRFPALRR